MYESLMIVDEIYTNISQFKLDTPLHIVTVENYNYTGRLKKVNAENRTIKFKPFGSREVIVPIDSIKGIIII